MLDQEVVDRFGAAEHENGRATNFEMIEVPILVRPLADPGMERHLLSEHLQGSEEGKAEGPIGKSSGRLVDEVECTAKEKKSSKPERWMCLFDLVHGGQYVEGTSLA